jgi:hypothetical protein
VRTKKHKEEETKRSWRKKKRRNHREPALVFLATATS